MPVVLIKGKRTKLKYPANWKTMSPKQKAAYIRSAKSKEAKKKKA